ncbi:Uncharacterised protein [uncultured archaeon]|nr:Uncharacterised protein [uncultured archaeon]
MDFIQFFDVIGENKEKTNSSKVNKPITPPQTLLIIIISLSLDYVDAVVSAPMVLSFLSIFIFLPLSFLSKVGIDTFFSPFLFLIQFIPGYAGRSHLDGNDLLYLYGVFSSIIFLALLLLRIVSEKVLHVNLNYHFSFRTKLKLAIFFFTAGCALLFISLVPKSPGFIFVIPFFYVFFLISTFLGLVGHAIIQIFRNVLPKPGP